MSARIYGECRQYLMREEPCAAGASRKPKHSAKIFVREQYLEGEILNSRLLKRLDYDIDEFLGNDNEFFDGFALDPGNQTLIS